jgi:hypothetical protein
MEVNQLTNEQIANLSPEQIEILETSPDRLEEFMDGVDTKPMEESKQEDDGADEPVGVSTKSGKGIIPYKKHKALRVENSTLREHLQDTQDKLDELLNAKGEAGNRKDAAATDDAITQHLERIKSDMPEIHQVITAVLEGNRKQGQELAQILEELKREREESRRAKQLTVEEQVAEAKENNHDLVHWESNDPEAWDEALRQDEILRTSSKWANKPYVDRFAEVVRRVQAILPEASAPQNPVDPEKTKADAKAKVEKAPARKPTTLSDIQGGANPSVSEAEQIANLSPHELAAKLMKMPAHKAAALRTELD